MCSSRHLIPFTVSERFKEIEWKNMKWLWASYSFQSTIYQLLFACCMIKNTQKKMLKWVRAMKLKRFNNVIITGRTNENNNKKNKRNEWKRERKTISKNIMWTLGRSQGNKVERHDHFFRPLFLAFFSIATWLLADECIEFKLFSNFFIFFSLLLLRLLLLERWVFFQM